MTGESVSLGPFMEKWTWPTGEVQVMFHCPGCGGTHAYWLAHPPPKTQPIWEFDGNIQAPSWTPSLRIQSMSRKEKPYICHLYVRNGQIEYLSDCTHELAGKTIPMQLYP